MRAVVQRVSRAEVRVEGAVVGRIGHGLLALVAAGRDDTEADVAWTVDKVLALRIFPDDAGLMNRALAEVGGALLVVSQFTLYGDCRKGRRPSFVDALAPGPADRGNIGRIRDNRGLDALDRAQMHRRDAQHFLRHGKIAASRVNGIASRLRIANQPD